MTRKADYPIDPLFLNRWSPRSYANRKVSDEILYTVLEAARWAPSATNAQPWRFIVAKTEEELKGFHTFINERNRLWSNKAPLLILIASQRTKEDGTTNRAHAFDTGAAWANIALQAALLGLYTRAIGGFDQEKARKYLNIHKDLELHVVIALGYKGERDALEDRKFIELEKPSQRRPLLENVVSATSLWQSS